MSELFPQPVLAGVHALLAVAIVGSGVAVITRRNPVASIAWLVVHFVATACMYLVLRSEFVAVLQVLVYAGAIIVLFLFVLMLLRVDQQQSAGSDSGPGRKVLVGLASVVLVGFFAFLGSISPELDLPGMTNPPENPTTWLAEALMTRHVVAFELASVLLVAAMAGVLVYTTRRVAAQPASGVPTERHDA